ncbi:hypothetical protein HMPREF9455_01104 [Dysgonomonas gadei ATCC BAA-286]|uniref:Thioredoxin domain-containing protein n=2 Tax=Dysgonomonas gadei TaxID=156974 RepID=F5IW54_9BACT|nr:hypothetical protein HMPREF9455_01104 [Dysgonomonas gadei ATCC BAA-286]
MNAMHTMKKILTSILLLFCTIILPAQDIVVERPPFSVRNHGSLEIEKIVLRNDATVFYITGYHMPNNWIKIASDTYIKANGQRYIVKSADGITLDKEEFMNETGQKAFTLTFAPIDKNTSRLDFIEGDCDNCFKTWGIELKSPVLANRIEVPQWVKDAALIKEDNKPLQVPELKDGVAVFKMYALGYRPGMNIKTDIYIHNPVTGISDKLECRFSEDGNYEVKVPLATTMEAYFWMPGLFSKTILLSPGEETSLYIDLQQKACQESRNRVDKCEPAQYIFFTGANAEINNEMNKPQVEQVLGELMSHGNNMDAIYGMSATEYKEYITKSMYEAISKLEAADLTKKAKQYAILKAKYSGMMFFLFGDYSLKSAYRQKHNLNYEDELTGYTEPVFGVEYYSFLKDSPINDPISLYFSDFGNMINSCKYLDRKSFYIIRPTFELLGKYEKFEGLSDDDKEAISQLKEEVYENWSTERVSQTKELNKYNVQKLIDSGKLGVKNLKDANALLELCSDKQSDISSIVESATYLRSTLDGEGLLSDNGIKEWLIIPPLERDSVLSAKIDSFYEKYQDRMMTLNVKVRLEKQKNYLAEILGVDEGIAFDLMTTQTYSHQMEELNPLSKLELQEIAELDNPFYLSYIIKKNDALLVQIEANKNKKGFNVYELPETEDDKILHEIIKPFAGKVVMIDFWATWCGPCRAAMKEFEPTKKSFADKDVVFVYLTDESSPETAWGNMIPNIGGEHYRIKTPQFEYLKKKFGVKGIPSYLILNKKGEQVYFSVGFAGAAVIRNKLNEELAKD